MNYAERTNLIADLLKPLLARFDMPANFNDELAKAELVDMVRDLNSEWPVMPLNQFLEVGERLKSEVRKSTRSRDWPTIGTLCKALKAALTGPRKMDDGTAPVVDVEFLYQTFAKHYRETKAPLRAIMRDDFPARLVADGEATWGDLCWHGGFDVPEEQLELCDYQNRHRAEALIDDLRAVGAKLVENGAPKGDIRAPQPQHWSKTAALDNLAWEVLRRSRAENQANWTQGEPL